MAMRHAPLLDALRTASANSQQYREAGCRPAVDDLRRMVGQDDASWILPLLDSPDPWARYCAVALFRYIADQHAMARVGALYARESDAHVKQAAIFALVHWGASYDEMQAYLEYLDSEADDLGRVMSQFMTGRDDADAVGALAERIQDRRYERALPLYLLDALRRYPRHPEIGPIIEPLVDHCNPHVRQFARAYVHVDTVEPA